MKKFAYFWHNFTYMQKKKTIKILNYTVKRKFFKMSNITTELQHYKYVKRVICCII